MEILNDDTLESMINFTCDVSLMRLIDTHLIPTPFELDFGLAVNDDATEEELCFALEKFEYWVENIVENCIVLSFDNEMGFSMFVSEGSVILTNPLMITPLAPTDGHLLTLFASKMNAIAQGIFTVEVARFLPNGKTSSGLVNTIIGPPNSVLPHMDTWVGGDNWFTNPWWDRNDTSTLDSKAPEGSDLSKLPEWAQSFDFLQDKPTPSPTVIIPGNFTPKIIED